MSLYAGMHAIQAVNPTAGAVSLERRASIEPHRRIAYGDGWVSAGRLSLM